MTGLVVVDDAFNQKVAAAELHDVVDPKLTKAALDQLIRAARAELFGRGTAQLMALASGYQEGAADRGSRACHDEGCDDERAKHVAEL